MLDINTQASSLALLPELYVSYESAQRMTSEAAELVSHDLSPRQISDFELEMNGGFNPLKVLLTEADYDGVVENMRLADGALWQMAITLDVDEDFAHTAASGRDKGELVCVIASTTPRAAVHLLRCLI